MPLNNSKRRLGIDVGGTSIKTIVFDAKIRRSNTIATPSNKKAFLKVLKHIVSVNYSDGLAGIGIGLPGILDRKAGKAVILPNLVGINELNVKKFLEQFHRAVAIDNDAKCILRAESAIGAARGLRNVVMFAPGTGVGGGILIDGEIYYGSGSAGEFGHMVIDGIKTVEELAGGRTLKKHDAVEFKRVGIALGTAMANMVNALNPDAVLLTGGLTHSRLSKWLPQAKATMQKYVLDPRAKKTKVIVGSLGEFAGAIGAAMLIE